ncbi:MAG: hypothetical protein JO353_13785 [Phycisphaerae bacterium]|nr:hypothetical protein [Phycisphaerae bacterium]
MLQLRFRGEKLAQLRIRAKHSGLAVEDYALKLLEDSLSMQQEAERTSISQIMAPVRRAASKVDDTEISSLVEGARAASRRNGRRKTR